MPRSEFPERTERFAYSFIEIVASVLGVLVEVDSVGRQSDAAAGSRTGVFDAPPLPSVGKRYKHAMRRIRYCPPGDPITNINISTPQSGLVDAHGMVSSVQVTSVCVEMDSENLARVHDCIGIVNNQNSTTCLNQSSWCNR